MGCKTLMGDEMSVYLSENNILHGVITIHVNDFQLARDEYFQTTVVDKLEKIFKMAKIEEG